MLAIPLLSSQIEAACKFREGVDWETKELSQLKQCFPGPLDAVKLKAVAVNTFYGTNVFAIVKVAKRLEEVLKTAHSVGPSLVEELVAEMKSVTNRQHYSFAAKYAHFFIDSNLPILDQYAEYMVARHLGRAAQPKNPTRYLGFAKDIEKLKELAGVDCDCAQLDAYLWVAGEYWCWKKDPKVMISADLRNCFEQRRKDPDYDPVLNRLLNES
jgi:hypothetical protein